MGVSSDIVVPFGKLEEATVKELVPNYYLSNSEPFDESDLRILKELFRSFYSTLEQLELVELTPTIMYDKIQSPVLGFVWFSITGDPKMSHLRKIDKGIILPITNVGELQYGLTLRVPKFRQALKVIYPNHRWLKRTDRMEKIFLRLYRRELYRFNSKAATLPQHKRLWRRALKKVQPSPTKTYSESGVFLWGLKKKGDADLLPDYRIFL